MRRIGLLLLAVVPVVAGTLFYLFGPGGSDAAPVAAQTASPRNAKDAKARAEQSAPTQKSEDDQVIADAPPGLAAPAKKELAQKIVSTAENSTLRWRTAYDRVEDIGDGCGYTAGIIGFCTGTHDLLSLVEHYTEDHPGNGLEPYLPALRKVDGTDSHQGLDPGFRAAWKAEAQLPVFRAAQDHERDHVYFAPSVRLAKLDGLGTLGQFIYYDAMVFHGPGIDRDGFYVLRDRAMEKVKTPAEGGDEKTYLSTFLGIRRAAMKERRATLDTSRIDTAQRRFLANGNMDLTTPLVWSVYGERYRLP
ncbi:MULTISPECIES: chitosanase [unclassified Streptomyces]|uniref:chitosanase n=1 Tax=unclassified Streptomyces TaxID=2593676 RepID=UPI001F047077|nr:MULTISPECIES: chitosanase [unclassified Streptomyces]MCH0562765.1 chitosanase [Streptomyces sp. MUM 2J]MCH0567723.1 chitosanase [Streptomyces sp. MUM 136J]